ncbi:MAG: hypothetical protein IJA86_00895 [Clostridia bacterium]|nr:hypothetical protein [Clostridia bacterium]
MNHTLLLGLGGTGGRVVKKVAQDLRANGIEMENGGICCAVMDTDVYDIHSFHRAHIDIPVITTSSDQTFGDLLKKYPDTREWCMDDIVPFLSCRLNESSLMRMSSRLAFLDTYRSGKIKTLDDMISKIIMSSESCNPDVRVLLVSSLCGAAGSGMLLQTALLVRELFRKRGVKIKLSGMLLLPDVFVKTMNPIAGNKDFATRLYANAYASLREIGAVTKIKLTDDKPSVPIKVDELFDSEIPNKNPNGMPEGVFDSMYLIDFENTEGKNLSSVYEYENLAAQSVYMQIHSAARVASIEDNLFLTYTYSPKLTFGSCGVAKAVYPKEEVMEYCVLKMISDVIGFCRRIDSGTAEALEQVREKADKKFRPPVNFVDRYIRVFEQEINKKNGFGNQDRFLVSLKEESSVTKVEMFFKHLDNEIAACVAKNNTGRTGFGCLNGLGASPESDADVLSVEEILEKYSIEDLRNTIDANQERIEDTIRQFDEKEIFALCDKIIWKAFPFVMSDLDMDDMGSVYGILTQRNAETGVRSFVHPLAARYLLYKLRAEIQKETEGADEIVRIAKDRTRDGCEEDGEMVSFDYPRTKKQDYFEMSPICWPGREKHYKRHFILQYRKYIRNQYREGKRYEAQALRYEILKELEKRTEQLIRSLEKFFASLPSVSEALEAAIQKNLERTSQKDIVTYVCATETAKKYIYHSLDPDFGGSDKTANRTVIDAVYGSVCAQMFPDHEDNKKYGCFFSIKQAFMDSMRICCSKQIKEQHEKEIDLDLCQAMKTEIASEREKEENKEIFRNAYEKNAYPENEENYVDTMNRLVEKLKRRSVPFLKYDQERAGYVFTHWGMHPALLYSCPTLANNPVLGNAEVQPDRAYPKNEICCYTSVYGIDADHFGKLKENEDGIYYKHYLDIVNKIDDKISYTLLQTPHIDKTWHKILPYLTEEKQKDNEG